MSAYSCIIFEMVFLIHVKCEFLKVFDLSTSDEGIKQTMTLQCASLKDFDSHH